MSSCVNYTSSPKFEIPGYFCRLFVRLTRKIENREDFCRNAEIIFNNNIYNKNTINYETVANKIIELAGGPSFRVDYFSDQRLIPSDRVKIAASYVLNSWIKDKDRDEIAKCINWQIHIYDSTYLRSESSSILSVDEEVIKNEKIEKDCKKVLKRNRNPAIDQEMEVF